jgi:hypothetical protein
MITNSAEEQQHAVHGEFHGALQEEIDGSQVTFGKPNIHTLFEKRSADREERTTNYTLTLHGGPVMATPGKILSFKFLY